MRKKLLFLWLLVVGFSIQSQTISKDFVVKNIVVVKDSIQLDSVPINPQKFKVKNFILEEIPNSEYQVDFTKALLIINSKNYQKITVEYFKLPEFITKIYTPFNDNLILPNQTNTGKLYSVTSTKKVSEVTLFEGLQTKGFITRGITTGNNQNAVTNSALDLEILGKLSKDVTLRANIFDTNIPIQENGYSQNITDFDRIFIEMFTDTWRVKAGDILLENKESFFAPFKKQTSGLQVKANVNSKLKLGASGAVVRGKFNNFKLIGAEGNQGPYKIYGANNEPSILIIAGSDQVYINGVPIERGENKQYTIDYNLAEITFNTTFPITNDMRITIEFQYSDRNYTRFVTYEEASYASEKLGVSGYFYSENDAKNQPIQQALTNNQKQILANAGNNVDLMVAESAFEDAFDVNKILYKKSTNGAVEFFEYSSNSNDQLYFVTFTDVGANNGNYSLDQSTAIGNIFSFVGVNQGSYQPIVRLIPPTKSQMLVVQSNYNVSNKTQISSEIALSNNDANLFSSIDDSENNGLAAKVGWQQVLLDKKWQLSSSIHHEYAHKNFKTLQRWESVEFNRDWNILNNNATKNYFQTQLVLKNEENSFVSYRYNHLNYTNEFNGNKHEISTKMQLENTTFFADASLLENTSTTESNSFIRANANAEHRFSNKWMGVFINLETNARKNKTTQQFVPTSHRFKEYETYFGIGDTTKVFAKIGFNYRDNDSIKQNAFTQINNRKTFYLNSKLLQNNTTSLSVFANYRLTENRFLENEKALNSRVIFTKKWLKDFINQATTYETSSGNVARQEYIYVKTEPGFGFYTWIDYNNDGIQDFDEFEIAQFQDQAEYLRVPKPNLRFIATQKVKINQTVTLNASKWANKKGVKKVLSHFYNQSFLTIENEQEKIGNSFNFNPFNFDENKLINLNYSFRNSLYFNKNLQKYSAIYTYANSKNKQQFFIGNQESSIKLHQLEVAHKFANFWLFEIMTKLSTNDLQTQNFNNRNYVIEAKEVQPKISFLYSKDNRFTAFYHFKNKQNSLQDFEKLQQQKIGVEYFYLGSKNNQITGGFNLFFNNFVGDTNSPVAYQMLEGLQAGKNYTWNVLFNRRLNSFLNINLNYLGRKSDNSKIIHTGSVQLRANF